MQKHKVLEIFKTFTESDVTNFRLFLNSPYFNKSKKQLKLYDLLIKYYPEFPSPNINKEKLMKKISPDLPFNNSTALNLFSDLYESALRFLFQTSIELNELKKQDVLREELFRRKLGKMIESSLNKSNFLLNSRKDLDSEYFINKYWILNDTMNHLALFLPRSKKSIGSQLKLLSARGMNLSFYYIKEMIQGFFNVLSLEMAYNVDADKNFYKQLFKRLNFEELIRQSIAESDNKEVARLFKIYLSMYLTFERVDEEKYYFYYKKQLTENVSHLSIDEIRFHTISLIRYCKLKTSSAEGVLKFDKELFELYKYIVKNEYYRTSVSEFFPFELFRLILLLSLKLKKYKWAFDFIKNNNRKLQADKRDNMYNFSLAEYYFHTGKYEDTLKCIHKIKLDYFMLKVDLKKLMLKTYYELGLFENALSLIDSYKHFLSSDKTLSAMKKKGERSFVNFINCIIRFRISKKTEYRLKLINESHKELHSDEWVKEKIIELDSNIRKSA